MIIETEKQRETLRAAGKRLRFILDSVVAKAAPGVKQVDLDTYVRQLIEEEGDTPSFLNHKPAGAVRAFPASLCLSVNDQIVHGIPGARSEVLEEGDVVTFDCGLCRDGLYVDAATTVIIGEGDAAARRLVDSTRQALQDAIVQARVGNTVGDIGHAVELLGQHDKFTVPVELCGHGVGAAVHEEPFIPNIGNEGEGDELVEGMVIALEPLLMEGDDPRITLDDDEFTLRTYDRSRAAHFEHTVIVQKGAPEIVTGPMW